MRLARKPHHKPIPSATAPKNTATQVASAASPLSWLACRMATLNGSAGDVAPMAAPGAFGMCTDAAQSHSNAATIPMTTEATLQNVNAALVALAPKIG